MYLNDVQIWPLLTRARSDSKIDAFILPHGNSMLENVLDRNGVSQVNPPLVFLQGGVFLCGTFAHRRNYLLPRRSQDRHRPHSGSENISGWTKVTKLEFLLDTFLTHLLEDYIL